MPSGLPQQRSARCDRRASCRSSLRRLRAGFGARQSIKRIRLGKLGKRTVPEELARLKGTPVLTVGETEQFVKENGMIGFCLEDNKIRFEINLESAERAKLKISARLLALAKAVIGKPKRD